MRLWAGVFGEDLAPLALEYTQTVDVDKRMAACDLWGTIAHVIMLHRQDLISTEHARPLLTELLNLFDEARAGRLELLPEFEDVHLNVEERLTVELGAEVGGRVHAARSRNDQVVTSARLHIRDQLVHTADAVLGFVADLLDRAAAEADSLIVGYTHGQPAQPISVGFWLSCHASMLLRGARRLDHAYATVDRNPLGACALAGTSLPIDRDLTTRLLGFAGLVEHALDATSSRDAMIEPAMALAMIMSDLSRMCEEIVIWSGAEIGTVRVADSFTTGSSIMPQKKNPIIAELARARSGTVTGAVVELLTMAKSVTLGYNCDLQQDKPPLWRAFDTTISTLEILRAQLHCTTFDTSRSIERCWETFATATELANALVVDANVPFRDAHRIVGTVVAELAARGAQLRHTALVTVLLAEHGVTLPASTVEAAVDPVSCLHRQRSRGGTAPEQVHVMIDQLHDERTAAAERWKRRTVSTERALAATIAAARRVIDGAEVSLAAPDGAPDPLRMQS